MAATIYALCEDGGLYMRPWDAAAPAAPWTCLADLGREHDTAVAVDEFFVYGVRGDLGVDVQRLVGASPGGWAPLAPGRVKSIVVHAGEVYGAGSERGGDAVYRLTRVQDHVGPTPWQKMSKGRTKWIAGHAGDVYCVGNPIKGVPWVYRQSIAGLSQTSTWLKCFQVPASMTALAILDGGVAVGILDGRVLRADLDVATAGALGWCDESAGLPCAARDLSFWSPAPLAFTMPPSWQRSGSSATTAQPPATSRYQREPPPPPPPRRDAEYPRRAPDTASPWADHAPTVIPGGAPDVVLACEAYPQWAGNGTWSGLGAVRHRDMDSGPRRVLEPLPPSVSTEPPASTFTGIATSGGMSPSYVAPPDDGELVWL